MEKVNELHASFELRRSDMSIKILFLFSHLGKFSESPSDVSDEEE